MPCIVFTEGKTHNIEVVSSVLFRDLTGDYSLGDSLSVALRNCTEAVEKEPACVLFLFLARKYR